jgi:hypothetical protein
LRLGAATFANEADGSGKSYRGNTEHLPDLLKHSEGKEAPASQALAEFGRTGVRNPSLTTFSLCCYSGPFYAPAVLDRK